MPSPVQTLAPPLVPKNRDSRARSFASRVYGHHPTCTSPTFCIPILLLTACFTLSSHLPSWTSCVTLDLSTSARLTWFSRPAYFRHPLTFLPFPHSSCRPFPIIPHCEFVLIVSPYSWPNPLGPFSHIPLCTPFASLMPALPCPAYLASLPSLGLPSFRPSPTPAASPGPWELSSPYPIPSRYSHRPSHSTHFLLSPHLCRLA